MPMNLMVNPINLVIGLIVIAIAIMIIYIIGRITVHVIDPYNKQPDPSEIIIGTCIAAMIICLLICIILLATKLGEVIRA
jgi:Kef-type K+ transport system membrane component KefB